MAYHKPSKSLQGVIYDLHVSAEAVGNGNNFEPLINEADLRYRNGIHAKMVRGALFVVSLAAGPQIIQTQIAWPHFASTTGCISSWLNL